MRLRLTPRRTTPCFAIFALLCMLLPGAGFAASPASAMPSLARAVPAAGAGLIFFPNPAGPGQTVSAYDCGFPATISNINIAVGSFGQLSPSSVTPFGTTGCYSISFLLPSLTAGNTSVTITLSGVTDSGVLAVNTGAGTGTLTFSPNPATAGQMVSALSCGYPTTASTATILIDGFGPLSPSSVTPLGTAGCYSFSFLSPPLTPGGTNVTISMGGISVRGVLTANSGGGTNALTFSPNPASSGQTETANGCGYPIGNNLVSILINGYGQLSPNSVTPSGTAGCYIFTFVLPTLASGNYTLTIAAGSVAFSGVLTVGLGTGTASLTLLPSTASVGSTVAARGCGFGVTESLAVTINSATMLVAIPSLVGAAIYTGSSAGAACYNLSFIVPSLANGIYSASLTGSASGHIDTGPLTVIGGTTGASLLAAPSAVIVGSAITVTGTGFASGAPVTVGAFGAIQTVTAPAGMFSTTITVPAGTASGTYTVSALDTSGRSAFTTLTVTTISGPFQPSVVSALPGQVINVTSRGFMPNEQVSLSLGVPSGTPFAIANTIQLYQAGNTGIINSVPYVVPNVPPGTFLLLALGQTSRVFLTTPFTVVVSGPTATAATPTAVPPTAIAVPPTVTATSIPVLGLPSVSMAPTTAYFADGYTGTAAANGKVTFTERLFFYNPGSTSSAVTTTYAVYDTATQSRTTLTKQDSVPAGATISRLVNEDVGNDRIVSASVSAANGIVAEEVVSRIGSDGTTLDADSSLGSARLSTNWSLAEGYTGESLQEYITLYNPGTSPANAQVQYLPTGDTAAPAPQREIVPAQGQVTINVRGQYNQLVPRGSRNIAAQITSDLPIAVDRAMYWGDGSGSAKYGYSLAPAVAGAAQSQYFALLPTSSGSQAFITVLNPNIGSATVTLSLLANSGSTLKSVSAAISGHARYTFVVPSILPVDYGNVSGGLLSSTAPVVAEAALYYGGSPNIGRHPGTVTQGSPGAQNGARADLSAQGALLRVFNPGPTPARVQVSVGASAGSSVVLDVTVAANAAQDIPLPGRAGAHGVIVLASTRVVSTLINGGINAAEVWGGSLN